MNNDSSLMSNVSSSLRLGLGLVGLVTFLVGLAIMVAPGRTAVIATAFIAVYAIVVGVVYAGLGLFVSGKGGWERTGDILAGVVFVVAGVVSFGNLQASAVGLGIVVAVIVGVAWITEGVVALATIASASSKIWTILYTIISVVAGLTLIIMPLSGAFTLWWLLGLMLVVMGIAQLARAFTTGR